MQKAGLANVGKHIGKNEEPQVFTMKIIECIGKNMEKPWHSSGYARFFFWLWDFEFANFLKEGDDQS